METMKEELEGEKESEEDPKGSPSGSSTLNAKSTDAGIPNNADIMMC